MPKNFGILGVNPKELQFFSPETVPNIYEDCDHDCDDADNERNARSAEGTWQELHHSHTPPFLTPIFIYILAFLLVFVFLSISWIRVLISF